MHSFVLFFVTHCGRGASSWSSSSFPAARLAATKVGADGFARALTVLSVLNFDIDVRSGLSIVLYPLAFATQATSRARSCLLLCPRWCLFSGTVRTHVQFMKPGCSIPQLRFVEVFGATFALIAVAAACFLLGAAIFARYMRRGGSFCQSFGRRAVHSFVTLGACFARPRCYGSCSIFFSLFGAHRTRLRCAPARVHSADGGRELRLGRW